VTDHPGVLAQISRVFGDNGISLASVIQKETDIVAQMAEVVITTHMVKEKSMQQALADLAKLPVVKEVDNFIRVEDI
jgi:homoserine dehydrogenase